MLSRVKLPLLRAAGALGAYRLTAPYRASRLLVACYHGVISSDRSAEPSLYGNTVSATEFAAQLDLLGRWFEFVDLAGAARWLREGERRAKPPVLITFDDGYRNNLTLAAPILQKAGAPAVFFLATGYIGTDRLLWPLELEARLMQAHPGNLALIQERRRFCKSAPDAERLRYLEQLRQSTTLDRSRVDREMNDFMSWDEVRTLAALGFDLGSHTVEHPILSRLEPADLERELTASRARIAAETGREISSIAYPNGGAADYNAAVCAAAARAGYTLAFAVEDRFATRQDNPLAIRRWIVSGHRPPEIFRFTVSGLRDLV
jgi:peptidoglycan/xylan/chitin deacetylase (PgdA/CDA1 family)